MWETTLAFVWLVELGAVGHIIPTVTVNKYTASV